MPSLIPGYTYDIFISYRKKDNQYDGWVTEFVSNLRKELEATFKDSVSIYFDENPQDGLLEMHDVEASLVNKLKAVVFIPILSQTYCDPRSFAWVNEFLVFRRLSLADELGPLVQLRSGNVTNRVLPVRIHELEDQDRQLFENEMGGPLRAIDFIFQGAGINRPLRAKDDELHAQRGKVLYRDQVNKVANAIKELLAAAGKSPDPKEIEMRGSVAKSSLSRGKPLWVAFGLLIVGLTVATWWVVRGTSSREPGIAVLAFEDHSPDKDHEWLADELAEHLIHSFTFVRGMFVTGKTSSFYFKSNPEDPEEIGRKLGIDYILTGSVLVEENDKYVTIQSSLSRTSDGKQIWSQRFKRSEKSLQQIQNEIVDEVVSIVPGLILPKNEWKEMPDEVRELLMRGLYHESRTEYKQARRYYEEVLKLDPRCGDALVGMGVTFLENYSDSSTIRLRDYCQLAIEADPENLRARSWLAWLALNVDCDFQEAITQVDALYLEYPHRAEVMDVRSVLHYIQGDYTTVVNTGERMKKLDPLNSWGYINCGMALINLGKLEDAKAAFRKSLELNPSNGGVLLELGEISLLEGNSEEALDYWQNPICGGCRVLTPLAYVAVGNLARANAVLDSVITTSPSSYETMIAATFAHLGDREKCYFWLERAVVEDCFGFAQVAMHPLYFRSIASEPRYREIINSLRIAAPD